LQPPLATTLVNELKVRAFARFSVGPGLIEYALFIDPPLSTSRRQFLHYDYRGSFWYWEIVLTLRKLLLTAVLSVVR